VGLNAVRVTAGTTDPPISRELEVIEEVGGVVF
jgi:hypothetical protein